MKSHANELTLDSDSNCNKTNKHSNSHSWIEIRNKMHFLKYIYLAKNIIKCSEWTSGERIFRINWNEQSKWTDSINWIKQKKQGLCAFWHELNQALLCFCLFNNLLLTWKDHKQRHLHNFTREVIKYNCIKIAHWIKLIRGIADAVVITQTKMETHKCSFNEFITKALSFCSNAAEFASRVRRVCLFRTINIMYPFSSAS